MDDENVAMIFAHNMSNLCFDVSIKTNMYMYKNENSSSSFFSLFFSSRFVNINERIQLREE